MLHHRLLKTEPIPICLEGSIVSIEYRTVSQYNMTLMEYRAIGFEGSMILMEYQTIDREGSMILMGYRTHGLKGGTVLEEYRTLALKEV